MSDLIERQDAIDMKFSHGITEDGLLYIPYREVKTNLEKLPSAQPEPIKLWLDHELSKEEYERLKKDCAEQPIILLPKESAQQWIPCSERLPDYDGYDEVITTVNGRHGNTGYDNGVCTNVQYDDIDELWYIDDVYEPNITVTAWMPLPEPYKEAGHE